MRSWVIGSDPGCDLVVAAPSVSGRHCRLSRTEEGYTLEDLGSTNGTFVNGQRVGSRARVSPADRVTLGQNVPMPWPPEPERRDFYLYIDEFQTFATLSLAGILQEARKYRLNLVMAHQYLGQLEEEVRKAIFGNVGTVMAFRLGAEDAEYLAREFYPVFREDDFLNLPPYRIYLRMLIDGVMSKPFSARSWSGLG